MAAKWMPAVVGLMVVPICALAHGVNPFLSHKCQVCFGTEGGLIICDTATCYLDQDCSGDAWTDDDGNIHVRAFCVPHKARPVDPNQ